jgi:hypothetical protein
MFVSYVGNFSELIQPKPIMIKIDLKNKFLAVLIK